MVVYVRSIEMPTEVILEWTAVTGDALTNHQGVKSAHVTEVVSGSVRLEIEGEQPQILSAGNQILLPTNTRYTFTVLADTVMRCHYSKLIPGQVDEIAHLHTGQSIRMSW